jgi:hypothetical protein
MDTNIMFEEERELEQDLLEAQQENEDLDDGDNGELFGEEAEEDYEEDYSDMAEKED